MNYFNKNLKYLLKLLGVSQQELALQAKVRSTTISNYVNNISKPGIEELVLICQYFGVFETDMIHKDFENGNLITDEEVENFKQNGKLNGNVIGNLSAKKSTSYAPESSGLSTFTEKDDSLTWAVMKVLKDMDGKLDQVRDGVEELKKKKG